MTGAKERSTVTKHATVERADRFRKISNLLGVGIILDAVLIDRGHPDGPEYHVIDSVGVITIYNAISMRLVTKLIARPGQLKRYYRTVPMPEWLPVMCNIAAEHEMLGYNNL